MQCINKGYSMLVEKLRSPHFGVFLCLKSESYQQNFILTQLVFNFK